MRALGTAIVATAALTATVACSADDPTPAPEPATAPNLAIVGDPELVFSWADDRCGDDMIPDLPARAIRDASGDVSIYLPSTTTYRLTGPDFDSLAPDCDPVLTSSSEIDPAQFNTFEWLGAPYTLDGDTVYALVHQEFHGEQVGDEWSAVRDFGDTQGVGQWSYLAWTGSGYVEMTWTGDRWAGPADFCELYANGAHPGAGCQPARAWTSPIDGTVTVAVSAWDGSPDGGDGVTVSVYNGADRIASERIANGAPDQVTIEMPVDVAVGDTLYFRVDAGGDPSYDYTGFIANVALGDPICLSGDGQVCEYMGITSAVSADGGATFTQADPPGLVAVPADVYDPEWVHSLWQPSNIVAHPTDGHYYALVQIDEHYFGEPQFHQQGTCAIRTDDLSDPTSWRGWGGEAYDVEFVNPHGVADAERDAHRCVSVTGTQVGALTYGFTYNEELGLFVAVGSQGTPVPGFYVAYSEDLINWTYRDLVLRAEQGFTAEEPPFYAYPAVIDHDSASLSFDTADGDAYLYYSYFTSTFPLAGDIYRVPIEFSDLDAIEE